MFIVIEGIDGSGKGTQTDLLVNRLRETRVPFETISFPQYGKKSAGPVEEYLNGVYGTAEQVSPYQTSILFAVDRFDASSQIAKWLSEGKVVISNRYVGSNLGHQGGKISDPVERTKFFEWALELEYALFKIPQPDCNIILNLPPEQAQLLVDKKDSRNYLHGKKRDIHEDDLHHLQNAASVYEELAKKMPRTHIISCVEDGILLSPQAIHEKIWHVVKTLISTN